MNARLHIGPDTTRLEPGATPTVLALGDAQLVREHFGGRFPGAIALENAIAAVEDELMRVGRPVDDGQGLAYADTPLHDVLSAESGATRAPITLDLAAVERLFSRLAAMSEGSPASHQGLPDDARFAARLLILRELMHHWRMPSVQVDDPLA